MASPGLPEKTTSQDREGDSLITGVTGVGKHLHVIARLHHIAADKGVDNGTLHHVFGKREALKWMPMVLRASIPAAVRVSTGAPKPASRGDWPFQRADR